METIQRVGPCVCIECAWDERPSCANDPYKHIKYDPKTPSGFFLMTMASDVSYVQKSKRLTRTTHTQGRQKLFPGLY